MDTTNTNTNTNPTPAPVPPVPPAAAPAVPSEAPSISIDDVIKVEIKVGKILSAEKVEKSDKLLKLSVDFGLKPSTTTDGSPEPEIRQILSGIAKHFPDPTALVGKHVMFYTNLASREMMGMQSNGMILAVSTNDMFSLLEVPTTIPPGTRAK